MPRYFFHLFNDEAFIDREGTELPSLEDARHQGAAMAGQMMAKGELAPSMWFLFIVDAQKRVLDRMEFRVGQAPPLGQPQRVSG